MSHDTAGRVSLLRENARVVQDILAALVDAAQPGVSTSLLNDLAERYMAARGCEPAFRGYVVHGRAYPASICTSINEEVMHGLPGRGHILSEGDMLSLDVGILRNGVYADLATTLVVGSGGPTDAQRRIIECALQALRDGIGQACAGNHAGAVSWAMRRRAQAGGFSVVENLAGHGIGSVLHDEPTLYALADPSDGPVLRAGCALCIEAILTNAPGVGVCARTLEDGWTMVVPGATMTAHFEAMVLVTASGPPEILGAWPAVL